MSHIPLDLSLLARVAKRMKTAPIRSLYGPNTIQFWYSPRSKNINLAKLRFLRFAAFVSLALLLMQTAARGSDNDELLKFIDGYAEKHAAKGEFETTDAYKARLAEFSGHPFVVEVPATRETSLPLIKPLAYDADAGTLTVTLLGNSSIKAIRVFDGLSPEAKAISPSAMLSGAYTKFLLLSTEPRQTREYQASNSFGATTTVKVLQSDERAVGISNVLDGVDAKPLQVKIPMSADVAQQVIPRAKWRLTIQTVIIPGQNDFILSDGLYSSATIANPYEIAVSGQTIMATLQRAEVFDPQTGTIYASFGPK